MTRRLNLNALVTIGGAVASSLATAVGSARTRLDSVGSSIRTIQERQGALQRQMREYSAAGRDISGLQRQYDSLGESVDRLRQRQERLNTVQAQRERNSAAIGDARQHFGMALAATAPFVGAGAFAAGFEEQMVRVGAIARASDEDLATLTRTARELGASTEWSARQAGEGMQFLAMSGFQTNEIVEAMPDMLSLATAGGVELGTSADIAANTLRALGLQASETGRVADVLTNTFTTSNTDLQALGDTMRYVATSGAALDVPLEDMAAAVGTLANVGIRGTQAGTTLRAMMNRLAGPTGRAADSLEELGIQTKDADGNLRPFVDILGDLQGATANLGTGIRAEHLKNIFGEEALAGALALVDKADTLSEYSERLGETGSAAEIAGKIAATTSGRWKGFRSALEETTITIGDTLLPMLNSTIGALTSGARWVGEFANEHPRLTRFVVPAAAAIAVLGVAVTGARLAWLYYRGLVLGVRAAQLAMTATTAAQTAALGAQAGATTASAFSFGTLTAAVRTASVALVTSPIFWAAALLGTAAYLIYKNWDDLRLFFFFLWEGIAERIEWVGSLIDWVTGKAANADLEVRVDENGNPLPESRRDRRRRRRAEDAQRVDQFGNPIVDGEQRVDQFGNPVVPGSTPPPAPTPPTAPQFDVGSVAAQFAMDEAAAEAAAAQAAASAGARVPAPAPAPRSEVNDNRQISVAVTVHAIPADNSRQIIDEVVRQVRRMLEQGDAGALYDGAGA